MYHRLPLPRSFLLAQMNCSHSGLAVMHSEGLLRACSLVHTDVCKVVFVSVCETVEVCLEV